MHEEESDSMTEVEVQEQPAPAPAPTPAPTTLCVVIIHMLYKAAGVVLYLWLSSPLWLLPVKTTLGWSTQYLQYLAAFALVTATLAHIPYRLPIPAIRA